MNECVWKINFQHGLALNTWHSYCSLLFCRNSLKIKNEWDTKIKKKCANFEADNMNK